MKRQKYINHKFEKDLEFFIPMMKEDVVFAKDVYRALCNMRWRKKWSFRKYSCSWRYAGGLVARLRDKGEDYIHFYCSGHEGSVRQEIKKSFNKLGWVPSPWPKDNIITFKTRRIIEEWYTKIMRREN